MRIAFLLPSLTKTAPIIIAANIIRHIKNECENVEVFYFNAEKGIDIGVAATQLNFSVPFSFENFDLLHTHMFKPDMYVMRHKKHIRCKTVATIHSFIKHDVFNNYSFPKNYLITHSWYKALKGHDALICLTETMRKYYQSRYTSQNIFVVNNGIEPESYRDEITEEEREALVTIKKNYRIIGTTSLLTKLKGLEIIIPFLQQHKNYAWYAPGTGNLSIILKKYALSAGVSDRCFFPGFKKNIAAFYPWYDIFAFPSRSEGFGLSLAEAALFKLPVICSDIAVFRELFTENEVAFFTLDNVNSFDEGIKKLEAEPQKYGTNAYNKLMQMYTAAVMAKNYLSVYKKIIS